MDNKQQDEEFKMENTELQFREQSLLKQANALKKEEFELKEKQQQLNNQQQFLQQREQSLAKDRESLNAYSLELETRQQKQERRQLEIEQGLPALRDEMFAEREQLLVEDRQKLKAQRAELVNQEHKLQVERELLYQVQETADGDFVEQRADLQRELQQRRSEANNKLNQEIQQQREKYFEELEAEVRQHRDDLKKREQELKQEKVTLTSDQNNVMFQQSENKQLQASLEQIIAERIKTKEEEFEQTHQQFKEDKQRLLDRIKHQDKLHSSYDELEKMLGNRLPEEVLRDLTAKNEELIVLREELKRPSQELEEYYDNHRAEITKLEQDNQQLQGEKRELQSKLDTQEQLEYLIRDCGLFRMKAKNLLATSQILLEEYGGEVPRTMDELVKLPGVGRKSANVILSQAFGLPGFAVDTHVMRVSHRLGLSKGKTPEVVEKEITKTVIPELWGEAHHWLIWHGRLVCSARKPKCDECQLSEVCPKIDL